MNEYEFIRLSLPRPSGPTSRVAEIGRNSFVKRTSGQCRSLGHALWRTGLKRPSSRPPIGQVNNTRRPSFRVHVVIPTNSATQTW